MGRSEQCSCSQGTCRLIKTHNMNAKLLLVLAIGGQCVLGRRQLRGMEEGRDPRSLVNSFPFNANDQGHHDHHGDHGDHAARNPVQNLAARDNRQAQATVKENPTSLDDVAAVSPGTDGKRCIDKVEMIEEIEYDDVVQCDHSYDKRCHTTYVTNYDSQQEEECEENFRKSCFIEYEQIAFNETVEICRTPILKDCDIEGPEICRTEYESECWTKQEVHEVEDDVVDCKTEIEEKCKEETSGYTSSTNCKKWPREVCSVSKKPVRKYTPITGCTKEPRELCAPAGCGFKQGEEICYPKHVTKLVPKLSPVEECVDVPKEVCTRSRTNPRPVKKPVVKKW